MSQVRDGDRVKVHYTGRHEDGTVFDSSEGKEPLEFQVGGGQIIDGVNNAVIGMAVGDKKTVSIAPAEGYGEHDDGLVTEVPKEMMPDGAKVGDQLQAQGEGQEFVVWITEIGKEAVTVDANHPLAGDTLVFDIELVEITPAA